MSDFIAILESEFGRNANAQIAAEQKAYMRDQFEYYGIKTPLRREIQKPFLARGFLPSKNKLESIVKSLWAKPERDYHLFAQELVGKYTKQFKKEDIALFEFMVLNNSWWDTVDFISVKLMGTYFKMYPEQRVGYAQKWVASKNIWLQRSALLFQLKYKQDLDTKLLSNIINSLLGSKEFFINKAIGWVLRDYSRVDPDWVMDFASKTKLEPLSRKEALRLIA